LNATIIDFVEGFTIFKKNRNTGPAGNPSGTPMRNLRSSISAFLRYQRNKVLLQFSPDEWKQFFLSHSWFGPRGVKSKVVTMKVPRASGALAAVLMMCSAFVIAPTRARANDFAIPFGGFASAPSVSLSLVGSTTASAGSYWATVAGAQALAASLRFHENHFGLGGNIVWHLNNMHDDDGGWRHHDDDGGDDDHGGKTPVPEPSTALLVFSGISALAGWRVRQRRATRRI
jgi:hypothetical protein